MKTLALFLMISPMLFAATFEARFKSTQVIGSGFKAPKACHCSDSGVLSGCPAKIFECKKI